MAAARQVEAAMSRLGGEDGDEVDGPGGEGETDDEAGSRGRRRSTPPR
jgi:hypothetical protein